MNRLITTIICMCLSCSLGWAADFQQANQMFDQANEKAMENPAQAQELYRKSILQYQYLLEQQTEPSAQLHANLGNAYFMAGDQGRAVLHYQRALNIDPLQHDITHNLQYVRSLTVDELPRTKAQIVVDLLGFWHHWPFNLRCILFAVFHTSFWVILALILFKKSRGLTYSAATLALLCLLLAGSVLVSRQAWDNVIDGVVIDREVIARQGNGYIYDNAFTSPLHAGTEFSLLERRGGWYHARLLDGSTCWLPAKAVTLIQSEG